MTLGKAAPEERLESKVTGSDQAQEQGLERGLERVLAQIETKVDFAATTAALKREEPAGQGLSVGWVERWVEPWDGEESVAVSMLDGRKTRAKVLAQVDRSVLEDAIADRQLVLLATSDGQLTVIGSICTRKPKKLKLEAEHLELTGTKSVLLKAGRAALELRQDGNVELVGSRISAASRGLFRIVGRMLRLN
jgi:hypothetical protein